MSEKQDFRPVKVKIKSGKQKSMKYISGDLLYSGVNLFGKLSEIYLEKIKNGEMFTGSFSGDFGGKEPAPAPDTDTPSLVKKSSTMSSVSSVSQATNQNLKGSKVFQMDQEIMSLFRKLQKKDAVTKVKALKALAKYVEKKGEEEMFGMDYAEQGSELSQVLTFFLYHFERIITYEIEKGVREAAHDVLAQFLSVCKKNFAQHIVNLFPLWYISWYDTAQEIRTKAKNNFIETFKTPEIRSALFRKSVENLGALQTDSDITISQNFLNFIQEKVLHFEMLLSEDMTTLEKPQRDSIYDRIISGCLESLADSFDTFACLKKGQKEKSWTNENTTDYIYQIIDVFSLDSEDALPAIFKFLGAKFHSPVRAGALKLLERMSQYMIGHDPANKKIFEAHIHKLSNSLFSAIADESSQVQRILWKTVLFNVCTQFKESIWQQIDIKKGVLPHLHASLKNAGFGAHTDLYKNFVAVVSIMPIFDFEQSFETTCKIELGGGKKPSEEIKEAPEEETKGGKKGKKQKKKSRGQEGEKTVKNSFSISEKLNVMYDLMKSLFSAIHMEEAIAFDTEIVDSYYDTMSFLMLKKIIPAMKTLKENGDEKNLQAVQKKFVQALMYPVTEYLKNNDPTLNRSVFRTIPTKFASTLTFLASKGIEFSSVSPLFEDIEETFKIGLEKSPENTIKFLSTFLSSTPESSVFYIETQSLGCKVLESLYSTLETHMQTMSKETIQEFSNSVEIFSYFAHSLLTHPDSQAKTEIFTLTSKEKETSKFREFTLLMQLLGIIKLIRNKMKAEFLNLLEDIQERLWLVLILRANFLLRIGEGVEAFLDTQVLELIFEGIKDYGISDDRYLNMVIQYISPADCLKMLVSESIQKQIKARSTKGVQKADKEMKELFIPYENYMRSSMKVQDNCLKVLFIDMIDDYSQKDLILKIYSIFKRKVEDYVDFKQEKAVSTILTEDTVKSFLESTLEFLQETEQASKSYQLSELGHVLSKLILNTSRQDALFPLCFQVCQEFFKILLKIRQNLSSAVEQWRFIGALLSNPSINHQNEFLLFIEKILQSRIQNLAKLSNYEEQEFNNEILVLRNLINSIPRDRENVVDSLSRVVLHEDNFSMLSRNCLILKVFQQTFLAGGIGFNIDDIALKKDENDQFKYIWLICELLTASYLPSLAGYTHLRTQIQMFCESEVYPLILRECCSESSNTLFFSMIVYLTQKSIEKSSLYAKTLGNILEMIIKPPEGLYELVADFNRWKDLLDVTIGAHLESVLTAEDCNDETVRRKIEMIKTVSGTVKTLLYSLESYQELLKWENLDPAKESNIIVFCSMLDEERWDSSTLQWLDDAPEDKTNTYRHVKQFQKILQRVSSLLTQDISDLASLDAILTSLNCAISKMGIANLLDNFEINYESVKTFLKNSLDHLIIDEATEEEDSHKNPIILNTIGINLLQFIKMVIGHLYSNSPESTEPIVNGILEYSRIKCEAFNTKMDLLRTKIVRSTTQSPQSDLLESSKTIQEQEFETISTLSETINTLIPYLHERIDEEVLFTLLSTHIESVQKGAYLSLTYFYQNFTPPLKFKYEPEEEKDEEEMRQMIQMEVEQMHKESEEQKEETKEENKEEEHDEVEVLKQQRIKGEPDKNIPVMMLEIVESPPVFKDEAHHDDEEEKLEDDEVVNEGYMHIQSASTLLDQKLMSSQIYSYFLAWNAMLSKISNAKMKLKFEQDHEYLRTINSLQEFLTLNEHVYQMFLILLSAFLPQKVSKKMSPQTIIDCKPEWIDLNSQTDIENFALFSMYNFTSCFPSLVREYYSDHKDRKIFKLISPAIMANEIRKIETAQASLSTQNLSFTLFKSTQEILADYINDEVEVQLKLKIPNEYPLKSIEVKCTKQLKMPEMKLRRWMLSISKMINSQNGDFISGILLWKDNIEKEIEGVEDCLICYCTVHVVDKSLPKLACKNCKNKFHAHCIRKWFAESQKSKCPMCQSYFW